MGSQPLPLEPDSDVRRVFDALRWIVRELRLAQGPGAQGQRLSAAQGFVLHVLQEHGTLSVGELAERTATDPSSVSVVVRKLHDQHLVTKQPSPQDHRRWLVTLSAAGARIVAKAPIPFQQILLQRMGQLTPDQLCSLADLLERVAPPRPGSQPPPMFFQEGSGPSGPA